VGFYVPNNVYCCDKIFNHSFVVLGHRVLVCWEGNGVHTDLYRSNQSHCMSESQSLQLSIKDANQSMGGRGGGGGGAKNFSLGPKPALGGPGYVCGKHLYCSL
jgi:hypothetical protein